MMALVNQRLALHRRLALLCLCLAIAPAAAGCGGDEEEGAGGGGEAGAGQPAQGGASAVKVDMKDVAYVPMEVTVKKGGTITWTNSDAFPHTVTKESGPGPKFDSGNIGDGGTFEQKFTVAGKIDYFCEIHSNQKGTITVE